MQTIVINKNDQGQRLDSFLKKVYPKISLSLLYRYIRMKRIKVNGKKCELNYRLNLNDKVEAYINDELLTKKVMATDFLLAPSKLDVVYEDDNILIVNKPIGLVVHEDESNGADNLSNRVRHYLADNGQWDYKNENSFIPSLVHRLDRNTSGLVLIAKNAESLRILSQKIKDREIDKYYLCKVYGIIDPKQGTLRDYLTRNTKTKIVTVTKKPISVASEQIITEYKTISHDKNISTLEIKLITGKTHQIRAHLAFIGHPLVGEKKYTTPSFSKLNMGDFQSLIAYKLVFSFKTDASILNYLRNKSFKI